MAMIMATAELVRAIALSLAQLRDPALLGVLFRSILATLAIFVLLGIGLVWGSEFLLTAAGATQSAELGTLIGLALTLLLGWVGFRVVAIAVLQFFADGVVAAVEARHYPDRAQNLRRIGWREEARRSVRSALRALAVNALALPIALVSILTGIGPVIVFALANAWLVGRELQDMVWLRHRRTPDEAMPLSRASRMLLGGVTTVGLMIPLAGLLAPVIGAASATHLVHRRMKA